MAGFSRFRRALLGRNVGGATTRRYQSVRRAYRILDVASWTAELTTSWPTPPSRKHKRAPTRGDDQSRYSLVAVVIELAKDLVDRVLLAAEVVPIAEGHAVRRVRCAV